jgi:hypothetical protein
MKDYLIIAPQTVLSYSPIDNNVDLKLLSKAIKQAEFGYSEIIGETLFNQIKTELNDNNGSLITSSLIQLISASKFYLVDKTVQEFLPLIQYRISDKGLQKQSDTNSSNLSYEEYENIKDSYDSKVENRKLTLIGWLKTNGYIKDDKYVPESSGWFLDVDNCSVDESIQSEPIIDYTGVTMSLSYMDISKYDNLLLYNPSVIINESNIDNNIDIKSVRVSMLTTQQTYLRQILGDSLYYGLCESVYNKIESGITIPQVYQQLLSVAKNYVKFKTMETLIMTSTYRISEKGVQKLSDNNSTIIDDQEIQNVRKYYTIQANNCKKDIQDFVNKLNNKRSSTSYDGEGWFLGDVCSSDDLSQSLELNFGQDITIVSGSFNGDTLTLVNTTGGTINITGFTDNDTFITGGTFNGSTLSLNSNTETSVDITGFTSQPPSWSLTGNTTSENDFIGTLEDKPFIIKTNNQEQVRIDDTGLVTIQKNFNLQVTGNDTGAILQNGTRVFHTAGNNNLFLGANAGNISLSTARENVGIGSGVMTGNTTGNGNTSVGFQALRLGTSTSTNTSIGAYTLWNLASGNGRQTAVGHSALANVSTPTLNQGNTAVGTSALQSTTTGYGNNAVGDTSLFSNTEGFGNNAFGYFALRFNTTGSENIAFGTNSMRSNTIGNNNIGIGRDALRNLTGSTQNIAIGTSAGSTLIGNGNVIIGNNVTLPDNTNNGMNIGGVIFAKNIYTGTTTSSPSVNGQVGIGVGHGSITHTLHVSGSTNPVRIEGLQNASDDTILTVDTNGELHTRLASTLTSSAGWYTTGNTGTTGTTNFIGTIDDQPLVFRTNNFERVRILGGAADSSGGSIQFNSQGSPYLTVSRLANNGVSFVAGLAGDIFLNPNTTGRVQIGTDALGSQTSALLQLRSTTRGFLPPRMTTTQRNAIASPATGLMVYDTSVNKVSVYNGTSWRYLQYEP